MINPLSLDIINKKAPYKVEWDEVTGSFAKLAMESSKFVTDCLNTGLTLMSLTQNIHYIPLILWTMKEYPILQPLFSRMTILKLLTL